jgi:alkanesulfonate monooxygenase SsuD/methylene tetrahydromethanopterin reductase-like flavin-dependent oxidoreductase (luciferase family)
MINHNHIRKPLRSLKLIAKKFVRMTFDVELRRQMRSLWMRKRITDPELQNLGDAYEQAFTEYLFTERVPKQVRKITRTTARFHVRETVAEQLQQLQKIAIKRQQPLAVIIEEALQRYMDKPENYLGSSEQVRERIERIV